MPTPTHTKAAEAHHKPDPKNGLDHAPNAIGGANDNAKGAVKK